MTAPPGFSSPLFEHDPPQKYSTSPSELSHTHRGLRRFPACPQHCCFFGRSTLRAPGKVVRGLRHFARYVFSPVETVCASSAWCLTTCPGLQEVQGLPGTGSL